MWLCASAVLSSFGAAAGGAARARARMGGRARQAPARRKFPTFARVVCRWLSAERCLCCVLHAVVAYQNIVLLFCIVRFRCIFPGIRCTRSVGCPVRLVGCTLSVACCVVAACMVWRCGQSAACDALSVALHVALHVASCPLHIVRCTLSVAHCLLHAALHAVRYMLSDARRLLHVASHVVRCMLRRTSCVACCLLHVVHAVRVRSLSLRGMRLVALPAELEWSAPTTHAQLQWRLSGNRLSGNWLSGNRP